MNFFHCGSEQSVNLSPGGDITFYSQHSFAQWQGLAAHIHSLMCTHMHTCNMFTTNAAAPDRLREEVHRKKNKRISARARVLHIRYQTTSAEAASSIFLTEPMFRPFALKHTFVSNERRYNQSLCQCQTQWQNHPVPLLNSTIYHRRKGPLNNHSAP